jgi:hypothetical protein
VNAEFPSPPEGERNRFVFLDAILLPTSRMASGVQFNPKRKGANADLSRGNTVVCRRHPSHRWNGAVVTTEEPLAALHDKKSGEVSYSFQVMVLQQQRYNGGLRIGVTTITSGTRLPADAILLGNERDTFLAGHEGKKTSRPSNTCTLVPTYYTRIHAPTYDTRI